MKEKKNRQKFEHNLPRPTPQAGDQGTLFFKKKRQKLILKIKMASRTGI